MRLVDEKSKRTLDFYLAQARRYLKSGCVKDPELQDEGKLVEYLMQGDGVDLSKIRTGEQNIPDNL